MTLDEANMTIDYLKEMQEGYIESEGYERHPIPEWYALDKAIEAIEQTKWISVSERLPEDGTYLVTVERIDSEPRIDIRSFAKDLHKVDEFDFPKHKCGWYDYDSEYGYWDDTSVIAWMPLPPTPYKAESEEQTE